MVVWPDWFNPLTAEYWNNEFSLFFDPTTGIDIDGAWIDMNEPASFCSYPCADPYAEAVSQQMPPDRITSPPPSDAPLPIESPNSTSLFQLLRRQLNGSGSNYSDILTPPYAINNAAGNLSDRTAFTDVVHANGLTEYDTRRFLDPILSSVSEWPL